MPKSRNKRKNGKTKRANGAGSIDRARNGRPSRNPIPDVGFDGEKLLAEIQAVKEEQNKAIQRELEKNPYTQQEAQVAAVLYGSVSPETLRAARAASQELEKGVYGIIHDEVHHLVNIDSMKELSDEQRRRLSTPPKGH